MVVEKPLSDEARSWRRELHTMSGVGFEEHRASAFGAESPAGFGLDMHRGVGGPA
jgi:metal-dependent amidase/aminoacylase/carboxypeptidase family protein